MTRMKTGIEISSVFPLKYAVLVLLLGEVAHSVWWYYTLPHDVHDLSYLPLIWFVITGLVLGLYGRPSLIRDVVLVVLLQTALGLVIHFSASALGKRVDFPTLDSWPIFFPAFFVGLVPALIGSLFGWSIQMAVKRGKQTSGEQ